MSRPRLIALLLALVTLAGLSAGADAQLRELRRHRLRHENPFVKNGLTWPDIKWAFTAFHAGNWHPLTWLSHMADCELFGLNAGAHHFVNVLFHAANAAAFRAAPAADGKNLAERNGRRAVRVASAARRIRRVDFRAQRRVEHILRAVALLSYVKFVKENCRRRFLFRSFIFSRSA
jgi:hypothetical protein